MAHFPRSGTRCLPLSTLSIHYPLFTIRNRLAMWRDRYHVFRPALCSLSASRRSMLTPKEIPNKASLPTEPSETRQIHLVPRGPLRRGEFEGARSPLNIKHSDLHVTNRLLFSRNHLATWRMISCHAQTARSALCLDWRSEIGESPVDYGTYCLDRETG